MQRIEGGSSWQEKLWPELSMSYNSAGSESDKYLKSMIRILKDRGFIWESALSKWTLLLEVWCGCILITETGAGQNHIVDFDPLLLR